MKILCLHTLREIEPLRGQIDALNLASLTPNPFSTYGYYANLLRHGLAKDAGERPWFLVAFRGERLIGYLALKETHGRALGIRTRTLGFLAGYDGDRPQVVAAPAHVVEVTEAFYAYLDGRPEWDLLEFQQQDAESILHPFPHGVNLRRCAVEEWPNMANHTIDVLWRALPDYFKALGKKFRGDVRRNVKRLFGCGEVQWVSSDDPASTPALFDLYCRIERQSWKSNEEFSVSGQALRQECMRGLLDPEQPMRLVISLLLLNGVPIAGLICGEFIAGRRGLYALHIAFDSRYSALGPGTVMLLLGMRLAIRGRYAYFNLLSGFGYYKHRWLAQPTALRAVQIYRVGRAPYWRRRFGNLLRMMKGGGAEGGESPLYFNPSKRRRIESEVHFDAWRPPTLPEEERQSIQAQLQRALLGRCESLVGPALAAIMPFAISPYEADSAASAGRPGAMSRSDSVTMPVTLTSSPSKTPSGAPTTPQCVMPT